MVRKEDLCEWFKGLPAHKRVDYMCGLLQMCHPLELRLVGTVLEDLAKKDFTYLRDQEIKANQQGDLSSNNSDSLTDQKLRAKIITALALMNSTNLPCAETIFDILQQHFDHMLELLHNAINATDLLMILTMAVHHPAFTFYQKDRLGQVLERVGERFREMYGDDDDDERDLILQPRAVTIESISQPSPASSSQSPVSPPEKATVTAIEIIDAETPQNQKGGANYRIHTTWSNGEITEVSLKFKQLQDLHHKILNKFPEEKKKHVTVPIFPGKYTHKEGSLPDQINTLNTYFRQLSKAPTHILDILTEPLRSGSLVHHSKTAAVTATSAPAVVAAPQPHPQAVFIQTSPLREDRRYELTPYHQPIMMQSYPRILPHPHHSPGPSQGSSGANSPVTSRPGSPALSASHAGVKGEYSPSGSMKGNSVTVSGSALVRNTDQISQLLQVLNLDEYYNNLKDFPFQQIVHMTKEDFTKAGLPPDAQAKLRSTLDQVKLADMGGQADTTRFSTSSETSPAYFPPYMFSHPQFTLITSPFHQQFVHPSTYPAQPGHVTLLPSPHSHVQQPSENSPTNSEASSPPHSPLLQPLSIEHPHSHLVGHIQPVPGPPVHMMSPTAAATALVADSEVKFLKNVKLSQVDSSGSEEERSAGYCQEVATARRKGGRGRPQQSRSLPVISHNALPASTLEAQMLMGMPVSISTPLSHHGILGAEPRTDSTPPPQTVVPPAVQANPSVVNGYISDPPPVAPNVSRHILNSRTFKVPQPAHTNMGVHKNVTNMPAPDVSLPLTNLGKNGAGTSSVPILHGNPPPHSYIGPSMAPVPAGHMMGLSPANFPGNSTLQPPPVSSLMSEGTSAYQVLMYPRGILTTIANSSPVMTSTQSHHTGPPMSHSPSPATTSGAATEQILPPPFIGDTPSRPEGASLTPPAQAPAHISSLKSHRGTNSGTPSPPLIPTAPKQGENQPPGRTPQVYGFYNGYIPPYFYPPQGHQPPQHFPNGITSEYNWVRFPPHNYIPFVYGSMYPHQNLPGALHAGLSSGGPATAPAAATNQSHPGGGGAGTVVVASNKSKCYNCGHTGHKASECEESRMENMSSTFHLKYKPSDAPA